MKNFLLCAGSLFYLTVSAQVNFSKYGNISGSFETINQYYVSDDATNAILPQDRIGSNNYFKADYRLLKFSAGIQYEAYLPSLQGYPFVIDDAKLVQKYLSYKDRKFELTAGNFYDQFGSGILFRSWENRQLGINNAMEGIKIGFRPGANIDFKFIYGKQRNNFEKSDGTIRAFDVNWNIIKSNKNKAENHLSLGAGVVSRYQEYTGPDPDLSPTVNAIGTRLDYSNISTSFSVEIVFKGKDPHEANLQNTRTGNALLINYGLSRKGFGLNINMRKLDNMDFRTDRDADQSSLLVNYLPALTKQQEFYLSNIYIYNAQAIGEAGGQVDLYYDIPKNTWLGGNHGLTVSMNISRFHAVDTNGLAAGNSAGFFTGIGKEVYYNDINFNIRKKHSEKVVTNFLVQHIYYNKSVIEGGSYDDIKSTILTAEVLIKYRKQQAIKTNIQHLFTSGDKKNWMGAFAEWSCAPKFNVFASDMYNYGNSDSKIHYYNFGGGYSAGQHKLMLSYGRQRAGLVCVGGVCRLLPAATGFNLIFTTNF